MDKAELGSFGEELAVKYLTERGYEIIDRNWRHKQDEIDIIAKKSSWVIIVEVKTRSGNSFGKPYEFVDERKKKALVRAAEAFIHTNEIDEDIRFDIISIEVSGENNVLIEHIENAISL